jgi:N-terminal acetyltransferase B complex non-catalytic subunit
MILTLRLRFRYLFTTSTKWIKLVGGTNQLQCSFCSTAFGESHCKKCLEDVAKSCAWNFNSGFGDKELLNQVNNEDVDPFADLAIVGTMCLLKLAGLSAAWDAPESFSLQSVDLKLLLQAIAWLDAQFTNAPRKTASVPLLLTKLYLLIGCVTHAEMIWDTLGVKNITLDSLGPLYHDRLSSLAPGMWGLRNIDNPIYGYTKHYMDSIYRSIPSTTRSALELGNYNSVIGMLKLQDRLRHSCTMVMAVVEDRRGTRAVGGSVTYSVQNDPPLRRLTRTWMMFRSLLT